MWDQLILSLMVIIALFLGWFIGYAGNKTKDTVTVEIINNHYKDMHNLVNAYSSLCTQLFNANKNDVNSSVIFDGASPGIESNDLSEKTLKDLEDEYADQAGGIV